MGNQEYFPSYSIGVSIFPLDGENVELLIDNAQIALKNAAESGVGKDQVYTKPLLNLSPKSFSCCCIVLADTKKLEVDL